jgi:hypothetical protein
MSLSQEDAKRFFDFVEKQSEQDGKISVEDIRKAVHVDLNNDGVINTTPHVDESGNTLSYSEADIVNNTISEWISNYETELGDSYITWEEFWTKISS